MYLFVFIFAILSVLGLYTELFSLRMANLAAQQKVAAETMMFWHGGVYTFAREYKASLTTVPATGCTITLGVSVCGLPLFAKGDISGKTFLPSDYNPTGDVELMFRSRLYQANNDYYVLTYLNPGEVKLGYTVDQFYRQMKNANLPPVSYGRVMTGTCLGGGVGHWLATQSYVGGLQICYTVPVPLTISDGAVGIITNLGS
ncbi:MAG: hypothetical protein PHD48_02120 [Alphaproteobacteria bacterium]|nr:hypothetical protein [Alphaproteobacteria bacterium]